MVLGGVILKLEEFEGAASEKDGGSGRGRGHCFFAWKIHINFFWPPALQQVVVAMLGGGGRGHYFLH